MPDTAGSKPDPPLSKAEPISEAGGTSVEMYLRKGKTYCVALVREGSEEKMKETALQMPRSVKKEREEEVLQAPEQRFPCSPWRRPW